MPVVAIKNKAAVTIRVQVILCDYVRSFLCGDA